METTQLNPADGKVYCVFCRNLAVRQFTGYDVSYVCRCPSFYAYENSVATLRRIEGQIEKGRKEILRPYEIQCLEDKILEDKATLERLKNAV